MQLKNKHLSLPVLLHFKNGSDSSFIRSHSFAWEILLSHSSSLHPESSLYDARSIPWGRGGKGGGTRRKGHYGEEEFRKIWDDSTADDRTNHLNMGKTEAAAMKYTKRNLLEKGGGWKLERKLKHRLQNWVKTQIKFLTEKSCASW